MTPYEIYEKHKGKRATYICLNKLYTGYVIGFSTDYTYPELSLIIGLTEVSARREIGWTYLESTDNILDMFDNPMGYAYAGEGDIIFKFGRWNKHYKAIRDLHMNGDGGRVFTKGKIYEGRHCNKGFKFNRDDEGDPHGVPPNFLSENFRPAVIIKFGK